MKRTDTVCVVTLGCPKNLVDSEVMAAQLGRSGLTLVGSPRRADAIVINTCAFIKAARDEAFREIERAARLRRRGPCRVLVVAGCLAEGFPDEVRQRFPEVDLLLGTGEVGEVAAEVGRLLAADPARRAAPRARHGPGYLPTGVAPRLLGTPAHYAYLKIAEGCLHGCAYCLIPRLRGPYRSRPLEDLVEETRGLETSGVREVVLVAQDTTAWGRDLPGRPDLTVLLRRILVETDLPWLRVLYGYPSTLPSGLVDLLAEGGAAGGGRRLCRYLDLPMQHASDRILRSMRRPETGQALLDLVERLRSCVPDVTIRSTFIIGFPGENDQDFQDLLAFLEAARLDRVGFFAYSPEPGTPAAALDGQVPESLKRERLELAQEVQLRVAAERRRRLIGSYQRIIVDRVSTRRQGVEVVGRGEGDAPEIDGQTVVTWPAVDRPPAAGEFVDVLITGADAYSFRAEPAACLGSAG